jgi:DNA-binding transcriptional ArsR family regulator
MTYQCSGLTALADPTRRAIFELINERPRPVGELARELPVSRPAVSQHLRVLKDSGLVLGRPVGNRRVYEIDPSGVAAMRVYLDQFWTKALSTFKSAAENRMEDS